MALDYEDSFPGQIIPGNPNYPFGQAKPVTSQGAGDGTPWSAILLNDFLGFFQKLLTEANVTPSGTSDTVLDSQYFDALKGLFAVAPGQPGLWAADSIDPPVGWLFMDGSEVSRVTYSKLFAEIGILYGAGDGLTTFNLPDARGEFIRFAAQGGAVDPGRAVGSKQLDQLEQHDHTFTHSQSTVSTSGGNLNFWRGGQAVTETTSAVGGNETRPRNIAFVGIIKY